MVGKNKKDQFTFQQNTEARSLCVGKEIRVGNTSLLHGAESFLSS